MRCPDCLLVVGCSKGISHAFLWVRLLAQALAQGRKKETITMMSERESGSETRRTKGREREGDHKVVSSLELRDAANGLFCFSTLGGQMTSGLTCDMLSWELKKENQSLISFLSSPVGKCSTSSMVLLRVLSGLSLRFQRWDLWLRPPSSSLSVVSCLEMRGRLRLRELIRWSDPGSWSLKGRKSRSGDSGVKKKQRTRAA